MAYTKTNWINDSVPAINAGNLNKIEQGIYDNSVATEENTSNIGDIDNLTTKNNSNVVEAINEVNNKFNYSTSEQVIGIDENGKPIYKRSFSGTTRDYEFTTFTSDYNTNSITIRKAYGSIQTTNGGVAIGCYVNSNYFAGLFIHSEELQIYYGASLRKANYNITIEFTKTTD